MAGRNMQQSAQIDLHGLTCSEAKKRLEQKMKSLPAGTKELTVIHGYHSGTQLAEMVRRLKCGRVKRKILTGNPGETIYLLED
ncbi:MAG: Smr/MutS family protein [Clostridia bacterium]|nr:Smr/MutS family protein [Clostridia bacterium]